MTKIFTFIGSLIQRKPFRSLLLTLLIVFAMISGASQMKLATGNETLVQAENSVLISNKKWRIHLGAIPF